MKENFNKKILEERVEFLKDISIFSETEENILKKIAAALDEYILDKDEIVFHKGDKHKSMYFISSGMVKVHDENHTFTILSQSDFFGEYSLIDSSQRSASITALEKTILLHLDQESFDILMRDNSDIARSMLKFFTKRLRDNNVLEAELTKRNIEIELQKNKIEENRLKLEELNATKDKFFTIIAHDLKNPFNAVIGLSQLLMLNFDTFKKNKIREFIEQIHDFSKSAYNLLENLLEWSKSQVGKLEMKPKKIDLEEIIKNNIDLLKGNAQSKKIKIKSNPHAQSFVYADPNMVTTIIRNLLSNAIKYTNKGGEVIFSYGIKDGHMEVSVSDTGIGMNEENLDKLFKIDTHYTTTGTSDERGTGLGLILCKEFIEKNGGQIWAESTLGKGSVFKFTLPQKQLLGH